MPGSPYHINAALPPSLSLCLSLSLLPPLSHTDSTPLPSDPSDPIPSHPIPSHSLQNPQQAPNLRLEQKSLLLLLLPLL